MTLFAVLLPAIMGVLGLVIDGSMLRVKYRVAQHAADAAATAAATALADGKTISEATTAAMSYVNSYNGLSSASVNVLIPPADGPYAGQSGFAEVKVTLPVATYIIKAVGGASSNSVHATAIAGGKASTAGAAVVVLDPSPPGLALPTIAGITLPTTPSLSLGGLEILGLGEVKVNGAVLVDTNWGGFDEKGNMVGEPSLLRAALTCMPLLSLTALEASDIRVTGGVDNPNNYGSLQSGSPSPLKANRKPVPDPLASLPIPTVTADPVYVDSTLRGGVLVPLLPLGLSANLRPGVYDYISIVAGQVNFQSGVYIIRGVNPLTGISLMIVGGNVNANGVMFYITPNSNFTATTGAPDSSDSGTTPGPLPVTGSLISAVVNTALLGNNISPLSGTGSPYDGITIFQNRSDRRIMVLTGDILINNGSFSGTVYAKWGHTIFAGMGTYDARFVVGSMRFANILGLTLQPSQLLPAAKDVYLVQ